MYDLRNRERPDLLMCIRDVLKSLFVCCALYRREAANAAFRISSVWQSFVRPVQGLRIRSFGGAAPI
jgi:hypothetical protein